MTGIATEDRIGSTRSSSKRRGHARVRRVTAYVVVVLLGVALLVLLALSATRPTAPLDPDGAGREGGMAVAEVLRDQGVDVEVVRSIGALEAQAPDRSTVLLADPANLGPGATRRLADASRTAGRLVLVGVTSEQLRLMGLPWILPRFRRGPRGALLVGGRPGRRRGKRPRHAIPPP